jgi:thymidylate synthase
MGEKQYLDLINNILNEGTREKTRNGYTLSLFGEKMKFSLENNTIPFLTSKKLAWKTCLKELLWFISGSTDNSILNNEKVHIWDGNADEYKNRIFNTKNIIVQDGELGPIYGHQWRYYNAPYMNCKMSYKDKGVDQLEYIINKLKNPEERTSRRLLMSAWNPCQIEEMALPPCHVLCQFHVSKEKRLHCLLFQRSGDVGLGIPFNIASYGLLTHLIAKTCDLEAYELVHIIGNAHIYEEHIDVLKEQLNNKCYDFPKIRILEKKEIDEYKLDDIEIEDYKYSNKINMKMKV